MNKAIQMAFKYHQSGNLQQAENIYRKILKVQPDNTDALYLFGILSYQRGDYDSAIKCFKEVLRFNPTNADAYYSLGVTLQEEGLLDEAILYYRKAIQCNPHFSAAYYNLGVVLQDKGRIDEAVTCYEKAIELNPGLAEAYNNLGTALKDKGQLDKAIPYYQKAIELNPHTAGAYNNLGTISQEKGQFDEATAYYQKTIELDPNYAEAHLNISLISLLSGNFKQGWKEYEWRFKVKDFCQRTFPQPSWDGTDITGRTVLLYTEQGLGDAIQFIRYTPLVAQRCAKVTVECQKELTSLLQNIEGIYKVISQGEPLPEFDVHYPLLSLPLVFDTTPESIPANIPYIGVNPVLVKKWRDKVQIDNSKLKIGLVWAGNPAKKKDRYRSCSLDTFSPLAQTNDITFYSLQKGEAAEQAKNPPKGMKLIDYTEDIKDFSDTAALIENLDLIISVDTAVAHLAGALGRPIWTLLPFSPDWRWMLNRKDSPWYPTMRLFRQSSPGDWESVINCVKKELSEFIPVSNFLKVNSLRNKSEPV